MTIIHRQFRLLNNRPANLRRPLLFGQVVMMFPNLRWSFRYSVQQSSVLTIPLLSFSKSFQVLSCWYLLRPDFNWFVWCIDWVLLSWLPTLAFLSWKGLQLEFPISWRSHFSCVPMLWLLCRPIVFAFVVPVLLYVLRLGCCISTLFQSKTFWFLEYLTWSIPVSKHCNQNFLLAF